MRDHRVNIPSLDSRLGLSHTIDLEQGQVPRQGMMQPAPHLRGLMAEFLPTSYSLFILPLIFGSHIKTYATARTVSGGIALYAFQAAQSLDRSLLSDLQGLRAFYLQRDQTILLSSAVLKLLPFVNELNGNFFERHLSGGRIRPFDLWIMSRLLRDFSAVLKGGSYVPEDLACLRYCLTVVSLKFLHKADRRIASQYDRVNYYGRNEMLGTGFEIESFLGKSWAETIEAL